MSCWWWRLAECCVVVPWRTRVLHGASSGSAMQVSDFVWGCGDLFDGDCMFKFSFRTYRHDFLPGARWWKTPSPTPLSKLLSEILTVPRSPKTSPYPARWGDVACVVSCHMMQCDVMVMSCCLLRPAVGWNVKSFARPRCVVRRFCDDVVIQRAILY